jgi:hypothetical protein
VGIAAYQTIDLSATMITSEANFFMFSGEAVSANAPIMSLTNNTNDATGPEFRLSNQRSGGGLYDGDSLGRITFYGDDAGGADNQAYASIEGKVAESAAGDEAGQLILRVDNDGVGTTGVKITGDKGTAGKVDVQIAAGTTSTTTVAGDLVITGETIELGHATDTTIARSAAGVVTVEGDQIVTEGTVDVESGAQAPVAMMVARRTITTAEANALHTTPIELIPAQGSNTVIQVVNAQLRVDRAASQANASCDLNLHYAGQEPGQFGVASLAHVRRFAYLYSTDSVILAIPPGAKQGGSLNESVNQGVEVSFDAASTNNCFTSIDVFVNYYVFHK